MGFRFIHSADWQLGKPFSSFGFGAEKAAQLQRARLDIIPTLATAARKNGARHILVAGDVWDQAMPSDRVLRQPLDRMARADDLHWWLLPGNHDPAGREGLWDRLRAFGLPAHIHGLTDFAPVEMEPETFLLPAPWSSNNPGKDLTAAYDGMTTPPGAWRVGIAHGGVKSFGGESDDRNLVAEDRAERSDLAYLALGDWHGQGRAGPRTFYAGTPEPDDYRNTDQGRALLVDLDTPDSPESFATGTFHWRHDTVDLAGREEDEGRLADVLTPTAADPDRELIKLTLSGHTGLATRQTAEILIAGAQERFFHLRIKDRGLRVLTDEADLDDLLGQGTLRRVADRLRASGSEDPVSRDALGELARLARAAS
jgi:DNA repair exonuclease SbcCD nuclease subunit